MKMNSPKDLNMLEEASTQTYVKTLIDIGEQYERWCAVRTLVLQTLTVVDFLNADEKTAAALLDIYDATVLQASAKQHGAKTVKSIATQTEEEIIPYQQALYNRTDDFQQKETTSRPSYKLHAHNNVSILSKDAVKSESGLTVHTEYAIPSLSESPPIVKVEPCDFDLPIEFTDNRNASGQTEVDSSETIPVHVQPTGIYENQLASASNTVSSITGPTSVQMAEVKPDNHYFEDMSSEEDIDARLQTKRAKGRPRSKRCKKGGKEVDGESGFVRGDEEGNALDATKKDKTDAKSAENTIPDGGSIGPSSSNSLSPNIPTSLPTRHGAMPLPKKPTTIHICPDADCNFSTKIYSSMKRHIKRIHEKCLSCNTCGTCFSSPERLYQHHQDYHSTKEVCQICGKEVSARRSLKIHMRLHEEQHDFVCTVEGCGKSFVQKIHFDGHMNSHMNVKPYKCSNCSHAFAHKSNRIRHEKRCISKQSVICDICGRLFSSERGLQQHMDGKHSYKEPKIYTCGCGRDFKWQSSFCRHKITCLAMKQS